MYGQKHFEGSYYSDAHKFIAYSPYTFFGLSFLQFEGKNDLKLKTEVDFGLVLSVESVSEVFNFYIFYIVIGKVPASVCPDSKASYQLATNCFDTCPEGTVSQTSDH